jgi:molybdopterin-guanine dinucleotide biosynthesis protein A
VNSLAYDAIILAGGRASRLGGVQKAAVEIGGRALLDIALEASAGAKRIVVVGPDELRRDPRGGDAASVRLVREDAASVRLAREEPPFGGPVAGIAAGLAALEDPSATDAAADGSRDGRFATFATSSTSGPGARDGADWVLVLACDLPSAPQAVQRLTAAASELAATDDGPDGVCLVDADGRAQWLAGIYRRASLSRGLDGFEGAVHGASVRRLVGQLELRQVADDGTALDVDTWQDVEEARRRIEGDAVTDAQTPETGTQPESPDATAEQADKSERVPPARLEPWLAALAEALELDSSEVPIRTVLDAARDIAHGVARPAAPLSTLLIGLAAAKRGGDEAAVNEACRIAAELAQGWRGDDATS